MLKTEPSYDTAKRGMEIVNDMVLECLKDDYGYKKDMGWRFRKSVKLPLGFRINFSKTGIGYSWGMKGYRKTVTANGRLRTTYSIPGTGISYVEEEKIGKEEPVCIQANQEQDSNALTDTASTCDKTRRNVKNKLAVIVIFSVVLIAIIYHAVDTSAKVDEARHQTDVSAAMVSDSVEMAESDSTNENSVLERDIETETMRQTSEIEEENEPVTTADKTVQHIQVSSPVEYSTELTALEKADLFSVRQFIQQGDLDEAMHILRNMEIKSDDERF